MKLDTRLYAYVGTSADFYGSYKVRFANDLSNRTMVLTREGHKDIIFVKLPTPMLKPDAINWLKENTPPGINLAALQYKESYLTKVVASNDENRRKRGRPPFPRDADGNIIRPVKPNPNQSEFDFDFDD